MTEVPEARSVLALMVLIEAPAPMTVESRLRNSEIRRARVTATLRGRQAPRLKSISHNAKE
jgi:hypothetical protein